MFFGLNKLVILSKEYRQTKEVTRQWVCKEKLHTKDTHTLQIWSNLSINYFLTALLELHTEFNIIAHFFSVFLHVLVLQDNGPLLNHHENIKSI